MLQHCLNNKEFEKQDYPHQIFVCKMKKIKATAPITTKAIPPFVNQIFSKNFPIKKHNTPIAINKYPAFLTLFTFEFEHLYLLSLEIFLYWTLE